MEKYQKVLILKGQRQSANSKCKICTQFNCKYNNFNAPTLLYALLLKSETLLNKELFKNAFMTHMMFLERQKLNI